MHGPASVLLYRPSFSANHFRNGTIEVYLNIAQAYCKQHISSLWVTLSQEPWWPSLCQYSRCPRIMTADAVYRWLMLARDNKKRAALLAKEQGSEKSIAALSHDEARENRKRLGDRDPTYVYQI